MNEFTRVFLSHFIFRFNGLVKASPANILLLLAFVAWPMQVQAQTLISISNPPGTATITAAGGGQFWPSAGTVNGTPISLRATVTSLGAGDSVSLFTSGDNPVVRSNTSTFQLPFFGKYSMRPRVRRLSLIRIS